MTDVVEGWTHFERDYMPNNISRDLKLIIELAFFKGAEIAYHLPYQDFTESDIECRLIGLANQMEHEREQFLKSPEGKGL